jgi:hypothetical protein
MNLGVKTMARHELISILRGSEEWSGGARSNSWHDKYSYDDQTKDLIVEHYIWYSDARAAGPTRKTIESTTQLALAEAPAEVMTKLIEMGFWDDSEQIKGTGPNKGDILLSS